MANLQPMPQMQPLPTPQAPLQQQPVIRPPTTISPGPQSQIVCCGCRTLLMYPQGAQNVRCARCGQITPVPPAGGGEMAQLVCTNQNCRVVLMYPRGATQVQCSVCHTINCAVAANQVGHVVCGSCSITLMYAHGAQSVKCAVCNHVTPVAGGGGGAAAPLPAPAPGPAPQPMLAVNGGGQAAGGASSAAGGGGASAGGSAGGRGGSGTTVVVENPPSLDEHGNEVQNIAVGVTSSAAAARG